MPELPPCREQGMDVLGSAARAFLGPPGLPPEIAARRAMPRRPRPGAAFRALAPAIEAERRAMWARRAWTQG